ncbi:HIT family protein [Pseudomonas fluvialis]|jgi:histidine triad (HIT) family protein|uniref:HIT family protein n=1 Tax=Pseudomonas fluvialis TaxID=1793966 RepID=A0ABQ2AA47_9PSED|nr:HIT family protein [Pseudomonas fluvialis]MBP8264884.1 HIT family protein [Pseudomonas sp.]OXM39773.1 HIT family protein [Pseudomonas fluvialis]TXH30173.1 MAG: HIT family protein [Burkholderiaceae bacterium]GGH88650.1 HIT family protein [Pseudomonas fluvialis]
MSLHGQYDPQNVFAKIIRGELPCYKIYEDEQVLAFLDLFPQSYGHTLVIPKQVAARNLLEVDGATLAQLMAVVQRLSKLLVEELQPDGVQIAQFNGAPAGQTVFHLHLHIIPRFAGDSLGIHASQQADAEQLKALQARLQKRLEQ